MLVLKLIALVAAYLNIFKKFSAKISLLAKKKIYKIITSLLNNNFLSTSL